MPFVPGPFAGQPLVIAIGESPTPPGWTRFRLPHGTFYATDVVCYLLFGTEEPDEWPAS